VSTFNPSSVAGTIYPIVGMGIGIGLLAGTAKHVTDTIYDKDKRKYNRKPSIARRNPRRTSVRSPMRRKSLRYQPDRNYRLNVEKYW